MDYSSQDIHDPSDETQELIALREKFVRYPKLSKWFDLYFDEKNQFGYNTYRNRTESAIIAYELDPNDPNDRKTAWEIGSQNSRKLKGWTQKYYETVGITKEKVLDLIATKAIETNNAKYLVMLAELTGTYEEKPKNLSQTNVQINNNTNENQQLSPEEEKQLSRDFEEFLEAKYRGKPAMNPDNI